MERDYDLYAEEMERMGEDPLTEDEWRAAMRTREEPTDAELALYRNRLAFALGPDVIAEWDKEDL